MLPPVRIIQFRSRARTAAFCSAVIGQVAR